ncbi:MAG: hypothetical protein M1816_005791 [Peltula sp. TS41687]|nr:MAG: hypothetical protein M1816_005791 [Peltula sp. TS41687]
MEWHRNQAVEPDLDRTSWSHDPVAPAYIGLSVVFVTSHSFQIGFCLHDGTFTTDSGIRDHTVPDPSAEVDLSGLIEEHIIMEISDYSKKHFIKIIGAGLTAKFLKLCPGLCSKLWSRLDIVPIIVTPISDAVDEGQEEMVDGDEGVTSSAGMQAGSAVTKCLQYFSPNHTVRVGTGPYNIVEVDAGFHARLAMNLDEYRTTVRTKTWQAVLKYSRQLKASGKSIAFFSSTPQGGGVALMRHALMRFFRLMGVKASWHVPDPDPAVFRVTKNNHNILQGVAGPSVRLTEKDVEKWESWLQYNARTHWTRDGGPLSKENGADVIVIDDPQMPGLIPIARKIRPDVPVIYRSHIEMRSDLIAQKGSPQEALWSYLWKSISLADVFISHPVPSFIPETVDRRKVGLLAASTDWLDGLNKDLSDWDSRYYFQGLQPGNDRLKRKLQYPARKYIVQVARFDPSKGIPDVIEAYAQLRKKLETVMDASETPQLVICGHGSIDDPDVSRIYPDTLTLLRKRYSAIASDVLVIQVGPSDQQLNNVLSHCHFAMQLSIREGFEVKVSEALHKGKPIVASRAGGIPLQVRHGQNGFLVTPGDSSSAAYYMHQLYTDTELYQRMSEFAKKSVSDEVSTVGIALSWLYLATKVSKSREVDFNQRWVYEMARTECGEEIPSDEARLNKSEYQHMNH